MNTIEPEHPLYFRRDRLAEGCLSLLGSGSPWLLLSAPTGCGKTAFLRNEFTDAAKNQGVGVLVCPLSNSSAATPANLAGWLAGAAGIKKDGDTIGVMNEAVSALARMDGRRVLVLDEFTRLAAAPANREFVAAFRSALDTHRNLSVVFTSSQLALEKAVFNDYEAPFFNFAMRVPFEMPREEFIGHMHRAVGRFRPNEFNPATLGEAFDLCGRRVGKLVDLLQAVLLTYPLDLPAEARRRGGRPMVDISAQWDAMPPAHRDALRDLATGAGAYPPGVTIGARTSALRALGKKGLLIHSGRGEYSFAEESVRAWVADKARA